MPLPAPRWRPALVGLALLLGVQAFGQEQPSEEAPPTFPGGVELVTVDVVVSDAKGEPVASLPREAFSVREDGQPQEIVSFEAVEVPVAPPQPEHARPRVTSNVALAARAVRGFAVVFDDLNLTPNQAQRAKAAIAEFLAQGAGVGDLVSLVTTGGGAWWSARLPEGRDELVAVLGRLDGRRIPDTGRDRMSDHEAMMIHRFRDAQTVARVHRRYIGYGVQNEPGRGPTMYDEGDNPMVFARAAETYSQATARNRITLDVIERVLGSLAPARGRKSLILVSQGFIHDSSVDEFKRVVEASRRANAAIYFLDTRGLTGLPAYFGAEFGPAPDTRDVGAALFESLDAAAGAESIAADTGGFSVKNTNDFAKGIRRISGESRTYYLLGYQPTNAARDGKFRKIDVAVDRKGVSVRARRGYYAPAEGQSVFDSKPGATDPALQAVVDSPFPVADIPLRATAYVYGETLLGKARVTIAAEVDIAALELEQRDGRHTGTLEYLLVANHRETGEQLDHDEKADLRLLPETLEKLAATWFPITHSLDLAAGAYQAKIVVRDRRSGRLGSLLHSFEVPELGGLRVSTPLLTDLLQPASAPQERPRPAVVARRVFAPDSVLYCHYEVYGAARDAASGQPRVSAGQLIRGSDGSVLTANDPTPIRPTSLGSVSRLSRASLSGAPPGDYELVISVTDEVAGRTVEIREPFQIGPARAGGVDALTRSGGS